MVVEKVLNGKMVKRNKAMMIMAMVLFIFPVWLDESHTRCAVVLLSRWEWLAGRQ